MLRIRRDFFQFVSFSVLSMVGQSLFILADTYFIANGVGAQGLAALNIVLPLVNIINGLGWMFGIGGATQFSITKSQGQQKAANAHFTQTVITAGVLAVLFTIICQLFARQILSFLGASGGLFEMAYDYYLVLTLFIPFFILNNVIISFIRNDYNPRLAMMGMICGGIINIIFDYIFIYPFGWGLTGAAIATIFSPAVSLLICSLHFKYGRRTLAFQAIKFESTRLISTLRIGFSSFLNEFSSAFVMLIFNLILLKMAGDIGVSAYSIVANMNIIAVSIFTGIGQGFQPLISIYHGKGNDVAVQKVLKLGLLTSFLIGLFFVILGFLVPDIIVRIFNGENNLQLTQLAIPAVRLYFLSFLFTGINFTITFYLAAMNQGKKSMVVSALRGLVLVYPVVMIMSKAIGINGIWLAMTIVELLTCMGVLFIVIAKKVTPK
ncbi:MULTISPECIES: MATE family efflux transporter [unclassified Jeotgalibaca]|uniref:MATE family efflux transporter n=1 Tax=unclassified Jeotgalibaca TaxID=2621505 RepID=UPI003FD605DB